MATNTTFPEDPYHKIFDLLLVIRDVRERFHTYSAPDIKRLIEAKVKAKRKEPQALQHLYELEARITDLRLALEAAKTIQEGEDF